MNWTLAPLCALLVTSGIACAEALGSTKRELRSTMPEKGWTQESVYEIIRKADSDPSALWQLSKAPMSLVYEPLSGIWIDGEEQAETLRRATAAGNENEYRELQHNAGRNIDLLMRASPIARDVLLGNPGCEEYFMEKMQHFKDVLTRGLADPSSVHDHEFPEIYGGYKDYVWTAERLPADMAMRILGPFLISPYYEDLDFGDAKDASPAKVGLQALIRVARKRGETVPANIEEARQWWVVNASRFARRTEATPAAPLVAGSITSPQAKVTKGFVKSAETYAIGSPIFSKQWPFYLCVGVLFTVLGTLIYRRLH